MKTLVVFLISVFFLIKVSEAQEKKLALIIGNSAYTKGTTLPNPLNDVRSMNEVLQNLGFTTLQYENVTLNELKRAIDLFGKQLRDYDVGLFYYAGHGLQYQGRNYLIPVDADLHMAQLVEFDCVPVDRVLAYMEHSGTAINLLILDACRNNPFERTWQRSVAGGNGLAFMNAPSGSLVAYATAPGSVASDGAGANGLYTSMLLKHMVVPNLTVEQVFKRVRTDIEQSTQKQQVPWESTSLKGDFYFNPDSSLIAERSASVLASRSAPSRDLQYIKRHTAYVQAEFPVQFGAGYELHFNTHFSANVQAGWMSEPNNFLLLNLMGSFSNDKLNLMIKNSFTTGSVYETGFNYHFKNNYLGVFAQAINLSGAAAVSEVEQNFNTDISALPVKPERTEVEPSAVTLSSSLIQGGVLLGRIIPLKNPAWQVRVEFALSKNFSSSTKIKSLDRDLSSIQAQVNEEMDSWYSRYGYIPSLTVGFAHTFGALIR